MKKLYTVTIDYEIIVLAEDEAEATKISEQTINDRMTLGEPGISPARMDYMPYGWDKTELPFGGDGVKTIGELIEEGAAPLSPRPQVF